MKRIIFVAGIAVLCAALWLMAQPVGDPLMEGFRGVEVASVADAMEQLYGQKAYMSHEMRALNLHQVRGPGSHGAAQERGAQGRRGGLARHAGRHRRRSPGTVYVMVLEDGADYAGIGGLMATAMKYRGLTAAVIDGSVRDTPQIRKLQFPVFSRGVVPSTTINHFRFAGSNIPVTCAGVRVNANDIIVGDEDGVAVVPRARAAEVLKKAQDLDNTEHTHDSVHREIQIDQGSGGEVRPNLRRGRDIAGARLACSLLEMAERQKQHVCGIESAAYPIDLDAVAAK